MQTGMSGCNPAPDRTEIELAQSVYEESDGLGGHDDAMASASGAMHSELIHVAAHKRAAPAWQKGAKAAAAQESTSAATESHGLLDDDSVEIGSCAKARPDNEAGSEWSGPWWTHRSAPNLNAHA